VEYTEFISVKPAKSRIVPMVYSESNNKLFYKYPKHYYDLTNNKNDQKVGGLGTRAKLKERHQ
jgi:hypothetical protein